MRDSPRLLLGLREGPVLRVSWEVLEADSKWGVLGERLASLLLVEPVEVSGSVGRLASLARRYRSRVLWEESSGLASLAGELKRAVRVSPLLPPVLRMRAVRANYCVFNEALREWEALEEVYRGLAAQEGLAREGGLDLERASARGGAGGVKALPSAYARRIAEALSAVASEWPRGFSGCEPRGLLREVWRLVEAPEGLLAFGACGEVESMVAGCGCSRAGLILSSEICRCGAEKLVLKRYHSAMYKWFLAAPLAAKYRFTVSPAARARSEYIWFPRLRRVVAAPVVKALCLEPRKAVMLRTYLDGTPVSEAGDQESWKEGGRVLALVHHAAGASLGDPNPGNILVNPPGVVDAEQARPYTTWRGAWDLAVASAYASLLMLKPPSLVEAFIEGYLDSSPPGEAARIVDTMLSPGFLASAPVPPHVALIVKRAARRRRI